MFHFIASRHRKQYIELGLKYHMWPETIYNLAHKGRAKTDLQRKIMHELLDAGIIHRHK